jgi:hypothetical protein
VPSLARAGAWTRDQGHFYVNLNFAHLDATTLYSFDFSKQPIQPYEQNILGVYGEVGVITRWLTLAVESQVFRESRLVGQGHTDGLGDMRIGAWTGLVTRPFRLSLGFYVGIPTGDASPSAPPNASPGSDLVARSLPTGDGEWDAEPRLAVGYSWGGVRRWPVRQYLQAELGYWFRTNGFSDAITYKLEVGTQFPFRGMDRFWLIWRFVGVESFASNEQAAHDATGLGDGVTYLAGSADVYGRIWRGLGASLGVDYALRGRAVPDAAQIRCAVSWFY